MKHKSQIKYCDLITLTLCNIIIVICKHIALF